MSSTVLQLRSAFSSERLARYDTGAAPQLCHRELSGRLTEISSRKACASLTLGMGLVLDAQRAAEPTAWVLVGDATFFPPDAASIGVDLDALAVVRAPTEPQGLSAAHRLAQSGAFGLIVVDLARPEGASPTIATVLLSRLIGLAQKHDIAIVFLTRKAEAQASLDSLVSLRGHARRHRSEERFHCELIVTKDKRRGPRWKHSAHYAAPAGLRSGEG